MNSENPVALITGGGRRIGAEIARQLHAHAYNIIIHYRQSQSEAADLAGQLNQQRAASATTIGADLTTNAAIKQLAESAEKYWQRLDVLVNNASSYYPTTFGEVDEQQWEDLIATNTKAPFFLSQCLAPALRQSRGCIVNIVDIHAEKPLPEYTPYSIAKAGSAMLTKALARELAPEIRVNGVAPGVIIWPENAAEHSREEKLRILSQVPLGREGSAEDIARTVCFFVRQAPYITGQILAVDGGRNLFL
ncbi:MAG: pteridine reductase [Pseudomonadota bacterium]